MFSISFGEMAIIALVLLIIVGPKRLPEMARFCGHLFGRINRQVRSIKREIKQEMEMEDLRQIAKETEEAVKGVDSEIRATVAEANPIPTKPGATAAAATTAASTSKFAYKSAPPQAQQAEDEEDETSEKTPETIPNPAAMKSSHG